jgi:hypothetical protein
VPDPDSKRGRPRGIGQRLGCGLGESLGGNATAFGYSVTITASFGAVEIAQGNPSFGDLIVFGLGSVVAFGGLEGLASGGFRTPLQKGSDEVVLLGTSLAFISIMLAIAAARGIAGMLTGGWAWFGGHAAHRWSSRLSRVWSSCSPSGCRSVAANPLTRIDSFRIGLGRIMGQPKRNID